MHVIVTVDVEEVKEEVEEEEEIEEEDDAVVDSENDDAGERMIDRGGTNG